MKGKTMSRSVLFLSFLLVSSSLFAQTAWNLALGSKAALRSYCIERSTSGTIGVWGDDNVVSIPSAESYGWVYSDDPSDLVAQISGQKLGFGVVMGQEGIVFKSCQLYDQNFRLMFQGYAEGEVIEVGDTTEMAWQDLVLRMPESVWIDLPNYYTDGYVHIRYKDEDGNYRYQSLQRGQGDDSRGFEFPTAFAGLEGATLMIRGYTHKGSRFDQVVDLGSGSFLPITPFPSEYHVIRMDGVSRHKDRIFETIQSRNSVGESPLFELTVTGNNPVLIAVRTSEGEIPKGFYYRRIDGDGGWSDWKYEEMSSQGKFIYLPVGRYHLDFKWTKLHSNEWKGYYWSGGWGEKG